MININFSKWPDYDNTQIEKVQEILSSGKVNYWTGNETKTFELEFAKYIGSKKFLCLHSSILYPHFYLCDIYSELLYTSDNINNELLVTSVEDFVTLFRGI